jgi:starch-binding outer membrane protein, SusD/RagB family
MRMKTLGLGLGLMAAMAVGGCKSLDITNPNDPDGPRALSDPAAIEAVAGGSVRIWINTYEQLTGGGPLVTQARTYSASWNNFNMNFYSSVDADGTRNTRPWQNDPSAAARTSIEAYWEGYYSSLGLANSVLKAIRVNGLVINTAADTRRAEAVALLMRGASLSGIALNYDKGYILDENSDLGALTYSNRKQIRDAALASFTEAATIANANTFTTPSGWANGPTYTNTQIARIANSMAAFLIVNWPRNPTEMSTQVNWATVVTLASNGISAGGAPFDFIFNGDGCSAWCAEMIYWFNSIDTGRVHTRVANMLSSSQTHPWPAGGNPQPTLANSPDRRLGDGSFGPASMNTGFGTVTRTANGGSDFAWSSQAIFNSARGNYHQSNIAHVRYDLTGQQASSGIYGGLGPAPVFTRQMNDLLWAEGLLRQNTNLALAATLINNSRVTRGGLPAAAAGDGQATLLQRLQYELEVELLGVGASPYYLQRRLGALIPGTPHEMPVPAKELGVFAQPLYTWGGTGAASSPTPP